MRQLGIILGILALVALAAVIALPGFTVVCEGGNETAAVATLRILHTQEEAFRVLSAVDRDLDGRGEYGLFGELSGAAILRGGTEPLDEPLLSGAFRRLHELDRVARTGYWFKIYLPAVGGGSASELTLHDREPVATKACDSGG